MYNPTPEIPIREPKFEVNQDSASAAELQLLPGIGEKKAAEIINNRNIK